MEYNDKHLFTNPFKLLICFLFIFISPIRVSAQQTYCSDGAVMTFELLTGQVLINPSDSMTTISGVLNLNECMDVCLKNDTCKAVSFQTRLCVLLTTVPSEQTYSSAQSQLPVFTIFAQKICLSDTKKVCDRGWAFERVKGFELRKYSKKSVKVMSRLECMNMCLKEDEFECRSANYYSDSNECSLSDMDRHTITESSLRSRKYGRVDYLESNCIKEPKNLCDFKPINGKILKTVDSVYENVKTIEECKQKCLNNPYRCHSFDLGDPSKSVCRTSHLDKNSLSHIENPYIEINGATTYELISCFNVTILCRSREMVAKVRTTKVFDGKIYAKSKPNLCVNDISNSLEFEIKMKYNDIDCDVKQQGNGQFTNDIVIQHNDMVVTTKDLALGVFCKFDLYNDSISFLDLTIDGDIMTDRLRGTAKLPDLSLHIVDINGDDINEVALGDTLRVQVRMSDEATYGIFVRNLVAKDGLGGTNNLTLIDNSGCPIEAKMMREVRTISKDHKSLESYLEAFTFTGSQLLEIEAEVETCLDKCRPVQCKIITGRSDDEYETVSSFGRRRKRSPIEDLESAEKGDILSLTMLSKRVSIKSNREPINIEMPAKTVNAMPFRKSKSLQESTADSPTFRVSRDEHGFYCFEPTTLATLSGLTLISQGFMLTAILMMATRLNRPKLMSRVSHA